MEYDLVIINAKIMTMDRKNTVLVHSSVAISNGIISEISANLKNIRSKKIIDAEGKLLTPGLIDCHTHLVYAGNRSNEFAMRISGTSYVEISNNGGGILSTVESTRKASFKNLTKSASSRAKVMLSYGATTIEIKSGYGLDLETEVKMLKVAKSLEMILPITVITSFLGAHTVPKEYLGKGDSYIDYVITRMLPLIAREKLAVFVDAFCETIAFNPAQVERLFQAAKKLGFKLKLHAEQLTNQGGAVLAANYSASSVDHLEFLSSEDCKVISERETVAVLLPGAFYFLNEVKIPPIKSLRENNVPLAIATDANPGSSPFLSLPLMMNMACICFGLTIEESFRGVTLNAAKALDLDQEIGSIEIGKQADLILWSVDNLNDIVYNPTMNYCQVIIKSGSIVSNDIVV
jgi:imidazolonepropionase